MKNQNNYRGHFTLVIDFKIISGSDGYKKHDMINLFITFNKWETFSKLLIIAKDWKQSSEVVMNLSMKNVHDAGLQSFSL